MSSELPPNARPFPHVVHNTQQQRAPSMSNMNAHDWSQAVISELKHIQVATPLVSDINSSPSNHNNNNAASRPNSSSQGAPVPSDSNGTPSKQALNNTTQRTGNQLEVPQRPAAGTMDSTATIDIVKQIPGGW